jgi:hypothetical protein
MATLIDLTGGWATDQARQLSKKLASDVQPVGKNTKPTVTPAGDGLTTTIVVPTTPKASNPS